MLESPVVKSYLLRIELLYAHRPIWRELWVPSNITLEFLHDVIQDSMGWDDAHMHCFEFQKRRFESMQFMDGFDEECEPEETVLLSDLLTRARQKLRYIYDFGDEWLHSVTLKKQVSALNDQDLYVCVGGEGACPMEDCGGTYGHERICNYLKTGVDDGFMPYEEWGVNEYDPDAFDAAEVTEDLKEMVEEFESFDQELDQIFGEEDKDDIFTAGLPGPSGPRGAGGFLPGFEEAFEEDEGDGTPEPYLNLSNEDQKLFREVMDAADAVHAIAPWKDLWDQDIFCIKDPQTGLLDFVSILGAGGEVFALHVHHGMEGYHLWQKTMLGTMPMDPESYLRSLRMIEAEFVNKPQMEPDDLALYQKAICFPRPGGRLRSTKFRRYHPRAGAPWYPEPSELPRLLRAMRLCVKYIERLRSAPSTERKQYLHQGPGEGALATHLPCFTYTKRASKRGLSAEDTSGWNFSQAAIDWQEADGLEVPFEPTEFELQQLANLPEVDEAWELGAAYMGHPVGTPGGPVLPILSMALPLGVPLDAPPAPYLGATLEITPAEAIWRGLAQTALERGCRPAELHVLTPAAESVLKPLGQLCQTQVLRQSQFQQLHELLNMLSSF
jgi:hypothetical protein